MGAMSARGQSQVNLSPAPVGYAKGITTIAMGEEITCFMFSNSSVGCSGYLWEGSNQINGISVVTQLNTRPTQLRQGLPRGPYTRTPYYPSFDIDHILYESSDNYEYSTPELPCTAYSTVIRGYRPARYWRNLVRFVAGHGGFDMLTSTGMVHRCLMMTMRAGVEAHRALACTIFEMDNTMSSMLMATCFTKSWTTPATMNSILRTPSLNSSLPPIAKPSTGGTFPTPLIRTATCTSFMEWKREVTTNQPCTTRNS